MQKKKTIETNAPYDKTHTHTHTNTNKQKFLVKACEVNSKLVLQGCFAIPSFQEFWKALLEESNLWHFFKPPQQQKTGYEYKKAFLSVFQVIFVIFIFMFIYFFFFFIFFFFVSNRNHFKKKNNAI